MSATIDNRDAWETRSTASWYATFDHLFAPERAILERLRPQLENLDMLDVGVGGGRTSVHFASRVHHYTAIDYSRAMIDECSQRFGSGDFRHVDVCDMSLFPDAAFDFVLFSFNGIDNLGFDDRGRALDEIRRVLRPGGIFAFSTHNLEFQQSLWPLSREFLRTWRENRARREYLRLGRAILSHDIRGQKIPQAYIRHDLQRDELLRRGAREVLLFSTWDGRMIDEHHLHAEPWLNYLCVF